MKSLLNVTVVSIFVLSMGVVGCAQKQAANSQAAIEQSKTMKTAEEQAKYLVGQANSFINSQKFDEAINTAKYVLANLDANSQEAKSALEKAVAEMKKVAQQKAEELKKTIGGLGQ